MQVSVQKLSDVLIEFDVSIDSDRVRDELTKAYNSLAKNARVRGFRKGRAPRSVLKNMFGASVAADVAQRLVDETFPRAVEEQKVQPVSNPAIEPAKLRDNQPFSYKARFEIVPEIAEVSYEGLSAEKPNTDVSDDAVSEELDKLRRAHATLEPVTTDRGAEEGDLLTIDFSVSADGQTIDEASAEGFQVELGDGTLLASIDEALRGKKVGDAVSVDEEMPEQHPHPALKGKTATFSVTVKELKERVLPEADDEFAKDLGDYDTLEELKTDLRERLGKQLEEEAENKVAEQLVAELCKANPIPVPPTLVQRQAQITEQEIVGRARAQGQQVGGVGDDLKKQILADSETKVRAGLLMAEIAKKEGIKIGDAEIQEGLEELAEQTGKNVAKLRAEYRDAKKREMLVGMILENKVLDIIEAKAKIAGKDG